MIEVTLDIVRLGWVVIIALTLNAILTIFCGLTHKEKSRGQYDEGDVFAGIVTLIIVLWILMG